MFNQSKYTALYYQIVNRAKERVCTVYTEKHHIVPRSLGGSNKKENIVSLTAREHFICHWLLTKMVDKSIRAKMVYALYMMRTSSKNHNSNRYSSKITARVYEKYKIEHAANSSAMNKGKLPVNKGKKLEGIELEKQRERTKKRRKLTPEENAARIAKMIATNTGRKRTQETKDKISDALKGKVKGPMSDSEKLKRSVSLTGRSKSVESTIKKAETLKQLSAEGNHHTQITITCPHCGNVAKKLNYARWHGNNCKQKQEIFDKYFVRS